MTTTTKRYVISYPRGGVPTVHSGDCPTVRRCFTPQRRGRSVLFDEVELAIGVAFIRSNRGRLCGSCARRFGALPD